MDIIKRGPPAPMGPPARRAQLEEREEKVLARLAEIVADIERAAAKELVAALEKDGASRDKAETAAGGILRTTINFWYERECGVNTKTELMELTEALIRLRKVLDRLTPETRKLLSIYLGPLSSPGFVGMFGRWRHLIPDERDSFASLEKSLPGIIARLPAVQKRKASHDPELHALIHSTAGMWSEATGVWPSSQIVDGSATAPLYNFLARHSGVHVSAGTWSRALRQAKVRPRGILDSLSSKEKAQRPRGPRRR